MPITAQDEQVIRRWAMRLSTPPVIHLARTAGEGDTELAQFCDRFQQIVPQLIIKPGPDDAYRTPAMIVGRHKNIAFQTVPQGRELQPFLVALHQSVENAQNGSASTNSLAADISLPAEMTLFITMHCPHCPHAVQHLSDLAHHCSLLRLAIVDGSLFMSQAVENNIQSVPTLILDGQLRWTGTIDVTEVVKQCIHRDPSQLSAGSLRQIIESGDAQRVAAMMIQGDCLFPSFIDLLVNPRWSVRLGAMVTVEYLIEENPRLAEKLIGPLWDGFGNLDISVQGDVIQVFGQIANDVVKKHLNTIIIGAYDTSVKEAAEEELATLMES